MVVVYKETAKVDGLFHEENSSVTEEADVLYISFQRPQRATDTETLDNGVLIRYRGNKIVGITVLNASKQPL